MLEYVLNLKIQNVSKILNEVFENQQIMPSVSSSVFVQSFLGYISALKNLGYTKIVHDLPF